ncbi:hypothetical protein Tco_0484744, partial [Tanacetum coccineum]
RYGVSVPALHKKPSRTKDLYAVSRRPQYAVFYFKKRDTASQRQVFTRKRVFTIPNTAYPLSALRHQQIRRIHQLDTTYRPFHSEQRIDLYKVGNNEGLMDEVISSDDDRNHTDLSMITKPEIKIGDDFLKILHDNSFNGVDGSDVTDHIEKVLEITEWIKIPNVDKD